MSKTVKKKVISLLAGFAIIGGSVATAVVLANLANSNYENFLVSYENLLEIRNRILFEYSKTSNIFPLSSNEFVSKVSDGSLKKWINNNFKDYFKSVDSEEVFDFNLNVFENENEILLILTPTENKTLRLNEFSNKYDESLIEFAKNKITFKFLKSDFLKEELFNYEQLLNFQKQIILDMQSNKITFESLMSVSEQNQKLSIMNWISKSLGISNIFSDVQFNKLSANNAYSIQLIANNDYILNWIDNEKDTTEFIIDRKNITINFNNIITISNEILIELKEKVSLHFQQKNIEYSVWLEHFENQDQIYQELIQFVYEQLNILMNNSLPINCIKKLELLNNSDEIYSLKIIPNLGYSFLSDSNFYDNGNLVLENIDIYSYIEFSETNISSFNDRLQKTIDNIKYSKQTFNTWIESIEFKQYITANLTTSTGINLDLTKIKNVSYDLDNNELVITPTNAYRFKILGTVSNVVVNQNGELVISNLNLFEYINFVRLDALFNAIQQNINDSKFTNLEFSDYLIDSNNKENFKRIIANNLYVANDKTININKLLDIKFNNNELLISLDENYTIYSCGANSNIEILNNELIIKNLEFYTINRLTNLSNLFSDIQEIINTNLYTTSEFDEYINDNLDDFKALVANKILINNAKAITIDKIDNISLNNSELIISLSSNDHIKYVAEENDNVIIENYNLIIKNLEFYTINQLLKLNDLFSYIQGLIDVNKYTTIELNKYITDNLDDFKALIATKILLNNSQTIAIDKIDNISLNNSELIISLSSNDHIKYVAEENDNVVIEGYNLIIKNLEFYKSIEFINSDFLFNSVQNEIRKNKFTESEFENNILTSPEELKNIIIDSLQFNINYSNNDILEILDINYTNNELIITLSDNYFKYQLSSTNNVRLENNKIIIQNLRFYQLIHLNINDFTSIREKLIDSINTYKINPTSIDILISKYIFNFIKNVQTTDNKKLEEYISTPRFVNNSLRIELKSSLDYYKFASNSINNIDIETDFISLLNITLLPTPIASSESCFTWSGNTITGLTTLGNQQTNLVLPKRANALKSNAFLYGNFTSIDMSLSNITHLPRGDGNYNNTLFTGCKKLETVILPYNLVEIGWRTFDGCEKLNNLAIPDTVISLDREYLFSGCSSLSNIIFPKQVSGNIGNFAFNSCRSLKTLNIPEGIVALNWASFLDCSSLVTINLPDSLRIIDKSAFERCTSLETVSLNNNLQTIGIYAFYDCKNLKEIRIPNSVTSIGENAFNTGSGPLPNLVIYVNSTNVQNLVKKVFNGTVILN